MTEGYPTSLICASCGHRFSAHSPTRFGCAHGAAALLPPCGCRVFVPESDDLGSDA